MRGVLSALQLFAAFFLTIFGLGQAFRGDSGERLLGALLGSIGLTFLALLAINLRKAN